MELTTLALTGSYLEQTLFSQNNLMLFICLVEIIYYLEQSPLDLVEVVSRLSITQHCLKALSMLGQHFLTQGQG